MLSIGDLSRRTGVKIPTIRYYEQMGLIDAPERTRGNQRRYTSEALRRLSFIRHARDLGLDISAIRELTTLSEHPDKPCAQAHAIANSHLAQVRDRIARLRKLEGELRRIVTSCDAHQVAECRVIESLADHTFCTDKH